MSYAPINDMATDAGHAFGQNDLNKVHALSFMKRRHLFTTATLALLLAGVVSCSWLRREEPPPPPPNIIIMLVDTLRADHVGAYGYSRNTTPFLDEFAQENVVFDNAYAQASWTKPSVASLFTSLYPAVHQTEGGLAEKEGQDGTPVTIDKLSDEHLTLAERFKHLGYRTHGWTPNIQVQGFIGFDQGFDTWTDSRKRLANASIINASVTEVLSATPTQPWLLYLHYMDVHAPYKAPLPQDARFDYREDRKELDYRLELFNDDVYKRVRGFWTVESEKSAVLGYHVDRYDSEIAYWDSMTHRLLSWLDWMKRLDNTIVIVLSDHGEEWMDHGGLEHGFTLYEEMIHVPLIVRFPKRFGYSSLRIQENAEIIDILPTLLDAARAPIPLWKNIQGKSLIPALERAKKKAAPKPEENINPQVYSRVAWDRARKEAVTDSRYKLITDADGSKELYDLWEDPKETRNLYFRYTLKQDGEAPKDFDVRAFEQRLTRRDMEDKQKLGEMSIEKASVVPDEEWKSVTNAIGYGAMPRGTRPTPTPSPTPASPPPTADRP